MRFRVRPASGQTFVLRCQTPVHFRSSRQAAWKAAGHGPCQPASEHKQTGETRYLLQQQQPSSPRQLISPCSLSLSHAQTPLEAKRRTLCKPLACLVETCCSYWTSPRPAHLQHLQRHRLPASCQVKQRTWTQHLHSLSLPRGAVVSHSRAAEQQVPQMQQLAQHYLRMSPSAAAAASCPSCRHSGSQCRPSGGQGPSRLSCGEASTPCLM